MERESKHHLSKVELRMNLRTAKYIGRYVPDKGFEFVINPYIKGSSVLMDIANTIRDTCGQKEMLSTLREKGYRVEHTPFDIDGKVGDIMWHANSGRDCVVKLTNKSVCVIVPMDDVQKEVGRW